MPEICQTDIEECGCEGYILARFLYDSCHHSDIRNMDMRTGYICMLTDSLRRLECKELRRSREEEVGDILHLGKLLIKWSPRY